MDAGRTLDIEQVGEKETAMNTAHSSRSTVVISPTHEGRDSVLKNRKIDRETQDTTDTQNVEMNEQREIGYSKKITTDAAKAIENVVQHDGPLIQPRPAEIFEANHATMRNKINLEVFLKVENQLYSIKENIMSGKPIFKHCRDYIEVAPKMDREMFEVNPILSGKNSHNIFRKF